MGTHSIKLTDHTGADSGMTDSMQKELQAFFDKALAGGSDKATISWGKGSANDRIVVHLVSSVGSSYIQEKMKGKDINSKAGGHTRNRGKVVCSEIYRTVPIREKVRTLNGRDAARLAFHECFHNLRPDWSESDLMGHGGLSDTPVGNDVSDWDKETMSREIAAKSKYSQQL
jgi:hypothetical protein